MTTTPRAPRAPRSPRNRDRLGAQRVSLLDALVESYPSALTLSRLREVAGARPGARIAELRRAGWQIATVTVEEESRLATYRLDSLQPREELEVHAACSIYHDSASGLHCRVHSDLSGRYSDAQLQAAAQAAQAAFRAALQRRERRPSPPVDADLADLCAWGTW